MTNGFHHIAITAADFDRTIQFYAQGLGFSLKRSWGEPGSRAAMLDLGDGGCIEIFEGSGQIPKGSDPKVSTSQAFTNSLLHCIFTNRNAEAISIEGESRLRN